MRRLAVVIAVAACSPANAEGPPDGAAVLQQYCGKCHAGGKAEGELGFITDTRRLVTEGYIVPGAAGRSEIVRRIAEGEMPPAGAKQRPSAAELAIVRAWIDGLPAASGPFRNWRELDRVIAADAARLSYDARTNARWLSLAHLANAGATDVQLDRYRNALATLLASLTWSAKAPSVVAIDPQRTVFRIDLRELGWSAATWDTIRAAYPYGVARGSVPEALRVDWFVATASRPPLYHTLLALPDTEAELARRLGIDLAEDIAHGDVARAAFTKSGVSVNNRVIERHATRFGALWRSYDFASSVGRENVFEHPLDFVPAGGEIIFNLPDGMQAYMLVDRNGKRIDRAPQTIVSDPRRLDRAVENGVSCMGCHASGILVKADQLRDAASTLERADRDRVRILHPTADAMNRWYAQDRARFARALAAINVKTVEPADEPINLLVGRYEGDLDLKTAAAELGLQPDQLLARLARARSLPLQPLAQGGAIKRDTWAALFPRIVDATGVGVPYTPLTGHDSAPAVWLDERQRTWLLVDAASDQATALGICRGRGYDLPRESELTAAIASGLAAGLSLTHPLWAAGTKLDASNLRYAAIVDPRTGTARRADVTDKHAVVCVQR